MSEYGICWSQSILSFSGLLPGASHHQVRMTGGRKRLDIYYVMNEQDAAELSSFDFREKPGNWTGRFMTRKDAEAAALVAFFALAGPNDVLTSEGYLDEVVAVGTGLTKPEFANDDEITEWVLRFSRPEYDSVIGHNAPPSIIETGEFILVHDGEGWKPERSDG